MLTVEQFKLLVGLVGVPVLTLVISAILRRILKKKITAGADWLLALMAFDGVAAFSGSDLQPLIRDSFVRNISQPLFVVLIFVCFITWLLNAGIIEANLEEAYAQKKRVYVFGWLALAWFILITGTALNAAVFVWR